MATATKRHFRARAALLGAFLCWGAAGGGPAAAGPLQARAMKVAKSPQARTVYSDAWSRRIQRSGGAARAGASGEFLFMGVPDVVVTLLSGGQTGRTGHLDRHAAAVLAKKMATRPAAVSRAIAGAAVTFGLMRYRANRDLYEKVKKGGRLTEAEASAFLYNWYMQQSIDAGRQLLKDVAKHERGSAKTRPTGPKRPEATVAQLDRVALRLRATGSRAAFVAALVRAVYKAKAGIFGYAPYLEFLKKQRGLAALYQKEMSRFGTAAGRRGTVVRAPAARDGDVADDEVDDSFGSDSDAAETSKPTILFFFVSWCRYCVKMRRNTFGNSKVKRYVRKNFTFTIVDCTKNTRSTQIMRIRFGVRAFPTIVVLDRRGRAVQRIQGLIGPGPMLGVLRRVK